MMAWSCGPSFPLSLAHLGKARSNFPIHVFLSSLSSSVSYSSEIWCNCYTHTVICRLFPRLHFGEYGWRNNRPSKHHRGKGDEFQQQVQSKQRVKTLSKFNERSRETSVDPFIKYLTPPWITNVSFMSTVFVLFLVRGSHPSIYSL